MSKPRTIKTIKELANALAETFEMPDIVQNIMKSITGIAKVMSIILDTGGKPGWHKEVNRQDLGETLSEKDEETLQPLVNFLTELPLTSPKKNLLEPLYMSGGAIDINSPYYKLVDAVKAMDASFETKAIVPRIEEASDSKDDPKPLAVLKWIPAVKANPAFSKMADTEVPVRLVVAIGHTLLDVLRLLSSMPGMDIPLLRQIFSVALASFEFYRGQWKQAILSGVGVYNQTTMYAGFFGKLFLNMFSLISPNLQDDMVYGVYAVTKSFIVGALLKLFQITAKTETRKKALAFFKRMACKNNAIDEALKSQGLEGQPANRTLSMTNIQGVQSASQDWTLTCSKEFADFIGENPEKTPFTDDAILKLLFQMLNMPTSMEEMAIKCKRLEHYMKENGYLSFKDLLVIEAGMTTARLEEMEAENGPAEASSKEGAKAGTETPGTPTAAKAAKTATENEDPTAATEQPKKGGSRTLKRQRLTPSSLKRKRRKTPLQRRSVRV